MKTQLSEYVEKHRIRTGPFGSDESYGNNGQFLFKRKNKKLFVQVSDGAGWDHVSVSLKHRCPTWDEMCWIKDLFFDDEETVVQFHPRKSDYINNNPYTLHLWKNQRFDYQLPFGLLV